MDAKFGWGRFEYSCVFVTAARAEFAAKRWNLQRNLEIKLFS